jgi:hypothetical protein
MLAVRLLAAVGALAFLQVPSSSADVRPIWDKPDPFWYRKPVTGGNQWLQVDALHGVREPLFDHRRLAIELNLKGGYAFTPLTLPFAEPSAGFVVLYDGSTAPIEGTMAIDFVLDGHSWRCDLQAEWDWGKEPPTDYECQKGDPPQSTRILLPAGSWPVRSPDGRWEAMVQNNNVVLRPEGGAEITRILSTDGTAAQPYDPGSLHWSRDAKTVTAYRVSPEVWKSDSVAGNVKSLVVRGQWKIQ